MPSKTRIGFQAQVDSAATVRGLLELGGSLNSEANRTVRSQARTGEKLYKEAAPVGRTKQLKGNVRGIVAQGREVKGTFTRGSSYAIVVEAKNPKTGFDYVAATRFGHNVREIKTKKGGRLGPFTTKDGNRVAPPVVIPRIVTRDWAARPRREMERQVDFAAAGIARKYTTKRRR